VNKAARRVTVTRPASVGSAGINGERSTPPGTRGNDHGFTTCGNVESANIKAAASHFDVDLTEKSWHDLMH
jgi:hypothetical protein